jgi:nucleotide-binding universal stress UspA family protein
MAREQIYVPLSGGPGDLVALTAARTLADPYNADVRAVFLGVDDAAYLMVAGDGVSGVGVAAVEALQHERERAKAAALEQALAFGLTADVYDGPRSCATAASRLAGLAVIEPDSARGRGALADVFEALLLEDGAPVFVARGDGTADAIAVAWDGSRPAARALKAACPLLARAREIRIVQAPLGVELKNAPAAETEPVRAWIGQRNPDARVEVLSVEGHPIENLLLAVNQDDGVDLLVAGAYGHARLREAVFGGVTRAMLLADGPSLLLAH